MAALSRYTPSNFWCETWRDFSFGVYWKSVLFFGSIQNLPFSAGGTFKDIFIIWGENKKFLQDNLTS